MRLDVNYRKVMSLNIRQILNVLFFFGEGEQWTQAQITLNVPKLFSDYFHASSKHSPADSPRKEKKLH